MFVPCRRSELVPDLPTLIQPDNSRTGSRRHPSEQTPRGCQVAQSIPQIKRSVDAISGDRPWSGRAGAALARGTAAGIGRVWTNSGTCGAFGPTEAVDPSPNRLGGNQNRGSCCGRDATPARPSLFIHRDQEYLPRRLTLPDGQNDRRHRLFPSLVADLAKARDLFAQRGGHALRHVGQNEFR